MIEKKMPNFDLPITPEGNLGSQDLEGNKTVIFVYPKDNTPGWTSEASEFRDLYNEFEKLGVKVYGLSKDNIKSHNKFKEKLNLPYELISDVDKELLDNLGVLKPKKMFGKEVIGTVRSTFLLNESGNIINEWRKVKVKDHGRTVLEYIQSI